MDIFLSSQSSPFSGFGVSDLEDESDSPGSVSPPSSLRTSYLSFDEESEGDSDLYDRDHDSDEDENDSPGSVSPPSSVRTSYLSFDEESEGDSDLYGRDHDSDEDENDSPGSVSPPSSVRTSDLSFDEEVDGDSDLYDRYHDSDEDENDSPGSVSPPSSVRTSYLSFYEESEGDSDLYDRDHDSDIEEDDDELPDSDDEFDSPSSQLIHHDGICSESNEEIPPYLRNLSNDDIRSRLQLLGDNPGPVTPGTRQTYLLRLQRVESDPQIVLTSKHSGYSSVMNAALEGNYNRSIAADLETKMVAAFQNPRRSCDWKEGTMKSSFTYLLLDPRITKNLPNRSCSLSKLDTFRTFVSAIFYVGDRPYCHLYEAINQLKSPKPKVSEKIERILDIWDSEEGVVSFRCFQNVIPVEAYTREACIVDALGLSHLTNQKRGKCHGESTTWSDKQRQQVGVHLLKKALKIFLVEGERQIPPPDIKVGA